MSVHRFASTLPGSAGWVLLELIENPMNGIGQLMDALNLGERTIERAVADLAKLGLVQRDNRFVALAPEAVQRCVNPVTQPSQDVNTASTKPVALPVPTMDTVRTDVTQNLSQDMNTVSTNVAAELTPPVQHAENQSPSRARTCAVVLGSSSLGVDLEVQNPNNQEQNQKPTTAREKNFESGSATDSGPASSLEAASDSPSGGKNAALSAPPGLGSAPKIEAPSRGSNSGNPPKEPKSRTRDPMFDAIAVASYGGLDGLTKTNRTLIGKAKKEFEEAGYSPDDVLSIGEFIREVESWRKSIEPYVLVQRGPAWRNDDVTDRPAPQYARREQPDYNDRSRYTREQA
jgi:hypothetical protein